MLERAAHGGPGADGTRVQRVVLDERRVDPIAERNADTARREQTAAHVGGSLEMAPMKRRHAAQIGHDDVGPFR